MYIFKNITIPNYFDVKNMSKKQQTELVIRIIDTILSGVTKIDAKIHKLTLTSRLKDYQIRTIFGNKLDISKIKSKVLGTHNFMCGNASIKAITKKNYDDVTGKYDPYTRVTLYIPYADKNRSLNEVINKLLNEAKRVDVSEVEYTIDFICSGYLETRNMFYLFGHYAYIPHTRSISFENVSKDKNITLYYKTDDKQIEWNAKLRCYERAGIGPLPKSGFNFVDLDRFRIEYIVKRTKLKRYEISTLNDLIVNTRFSDIIFNGHFKNLRFKKPKIFESNPLAEIKTFLSRNNKPQIYTFQEKYINTCGSSKSRNFVDDECFSEFVLKIKKAVDEYKFNCLKLSRIQDCNKF